MDPDDAIDASVAVLAGGVGAARFLSGAVEAIADPSAITAIVNTGDDCSLHGLSISPDLDTVTYTLAGAIDPERGWGLVGETWRAMDALERFESVRPAGSAAAPRWFNLGDRDLATHFYRTARLAEGASLTMVTDEIRRAWNVPIGVVPMSDDRLATMVTVDDGSATPVEISFQDYFVRRHHAVDVLAIRFDGAATLSATAATALERSDVVVIAPSNPLVSIGPIRSLAGVDEILAARRDSVVAVSPIVGGVALKGPADRMLQRAGIESSVVGVATLYAPVAGTLVVDTVDAHLAPAVEATGMRCIVTPTVMSGPGVARRLAHATVTAGR